MNYRKLAPVSISLCALLIVACGGGEDTTSIDSTPSETVTETTESTLIINEIVADAENDGTDWIELYAVSDIADLSIYSVVDDNESHTAQALPAVALTAGEFIVVQAIDDADTPPTDGYYVTFKLGGDDAVTLFKNDVQVDVLDWSDGDAPLGYSFGLYPDADGSAITLSPTQGLANVQPTETVVERDTVMNHNAQLRINEIVAKDSNDGYDWIEVYAAGDTDVFLGDYTVADANSELLSLPDVTISAGTFYRVYATTDNVETLATVAFKLGSSDEVSLFKGDDLVDQLSWDKGDALIGYSYGRFPDGSDAVTTLTPSAELTNVTATHGPLVINEVVASHIDGGDDWFELYNSGSDPILLSDYSVIDSSSDIEPIALPGIVLAANDYAIIYAVDEDPGSDFVSFKLGKEDELSLLLNGETVDYVEWQASDVTAGYSYGIAENTAWDRTTLALTPDAANQLPDVYTQDNVESIYFTIESDQWNDLLDNAADEEYHLTSVTYKDVTLDEVAIRTKGNSSLSSVIRMGGERFSFNVDINEYVSGQTLLGMKKFVLNNMFNDPSYMREYIAYELLEEMGVATPQHSYVNVYVNNELKGLYLLVEFVNKDFLAQNFNHAEGDLYKPDGIGSDLQYISDNFTYYSGVELKTNETSSDNGAFIDLVSTMRFGDALDLIDVDSVLRYMAVSVALSNLDSYHGSLAHNYYIYEQDNVFSFIPWDLNESFGSFSMGCERADIRGLYIDEPTDGSLSSRPLIAQIFANSSHLDTYHGYLNQLITGPLSSTSFAARVAEIDSLISEHVNDDPSAFYSFAQYQQNQTTTVDRFYGLTSFINYRVANMTQQLNGQLPASGDGSGFCGN